MIRRKKFTLLMLCLNLLCALWLFSFPCAANEAADTPTHAFMTWHTDTSTGIYILQIHINGSPLCGLELELLYDESLLTLASCERGEALSEHEFACNLSVEGRVKFILWGNENSNACGKMLSFSFVKKENASGEGELSLIAPKKNSALAFSDGEILSVPLATENLRVYIQSENSSDNASAEPTEPDEKPVEEQSCVTPDNEAPSEQVTGQGQNAFQENPPRTPARGIRQIMQTANKIVFALNAAAACIMSLPHFLPDIFRWGYF